MSTYILFWNPAISSFKLEYLQDMLDCDNNDPTFNWSIWEHENAHIGDRFFLVRCKNRPVPGKLNQYGKQLWEPCIDETTGICMAGNFTSDPYEGEDWSGKGRETYYMDMNIDQATDPDECVIVSTAESGTGVIVKWLKISKNKKSKSANVPNLFPAYPCQHSLSC